VSPLFETGLYLTGGTAAWRAHLNHRYSNDLDFFVNDDPAFGLWADRFIQALRKLPGWSLDVVLREERFVRCSVVAGDLALPRALPLNSTQNRAGPEFLQEFHGGHDFHTVIASATASLVADDDSSFEGNLLT
jgi:hypothetical protein